MRRIPTITALALLPLLGTLVAPGAQASPSSPTANDCFLDDKDCRFGPKTFPSSVEPLLDGYQRLGGLGQKSFEGTYWDKGAKQGKGSWRYPDNDGFYTPDNGKPDRTETTLPVGTKLDRFGLCGGFYLAVAGTPFAKRSMPPNSLSPNRFKYRKFKVLQPLKVDKGPAAPYFNQPGGGIQFKTSKSVAQLVKDKVLSKPTPACETTP